MFHPTLLYRCIFSPKMTLAQYIVPKDNFRPAMGIRRRPPPCRHIVPRNDLLRPVVGIDMDPRCCRYAKQPNNDRLLCAIPDSPNQNPCPAVGIQFELLCLAVGIRLDPCCCRYTRQPNQITLSCLARLLALPYLL